MLVGQLFQRADQPEKAREQITAAMAMYREMEMRFWPEHAPAIAGPPP